MKLSILMSLVVALCAFNVSAEEVPAKEIVIGIHDAFVPGGFDSESDVYIVASGLFPNSCYSWQAAKVTTDKQANITEVKATALVSQGMCLMVLVPFSKEIHLGVLGSGEHKVRFMAGDGTYLEKTISIE